VKRLTLETQSSDQPKLSTLLNESNQASQARMISEMRKRRTLNKLFLDGMYLKESKDIRVLNEEMSTAMADLAVEENLPAEKEKVARNHLLTLIQAGVPAAAAYRVIKNIIKGNFLEAFKNLPGINYLLIPEAIYELVMSGLGALPENIKKDVIDNPGAQAMLRLLFSMKELQKSEDIGQFYDNLQALLKDSSHALIVFAGFLKSMAETCALYGVALTGAGLSVLAFIEGLSLGAATPAVASALGVGLAVLAAFDTICLTLVAAMAGTGAVGAGGKFLGFLINKVSKMDPDADIFRDEKFRKEVASLVQGLSEEHTKKMQEKEDEMKVAFDQAEPLEFDDVEDKKEDLLSDPITMPYSPEAPTPEEDLKLVAENKTYKRWQVLSGIN
jgi:hypothetical protein